MLTKCGVDCSTCPSYEKDCAGCEAIKGNVYWTEHIGGGTCPIYKCCEDNSHEHCGKCGSLPCNTWKELKDPSMTDEQHLDALNQRVKLLREMK